MFQTITAAAETASGTCGVRVTWTFDSGTITINGTGKMTDWDYGKAPW